MDKSITWHNYKEFQNENYSKFIRTFNKNNTSK